MVKKESLMNYFDTEKGKEISGHFFIDYTNQTEVSKNVYHGLWKGFNNAKLQGKNKKSWAIPYVNKLFQIWRGKGFFDERIIGYEERKNKAGKKSKYPMKRYRLNLNLFYDYAKERKVNGFSESEKEFLEHLFNLKNIRQGIKDYKGNVNEYICAVLTELFFIKTANAVMVGEWMFKNFLNGKKLSTDCTNKKFMEIKGEKKLFIPNGQNYEDELLAKNKIYKVFKEKLEKLLSTGIKMIMAPIEFKVMVSKKTGEVIVPELYSKDISEYFGGLA